MLWRQGSTGLKFGYPPHPPPTPGIDSRIEYIRRRGFRQSLRRAPDEAPAPVPTALPVAGRNSGRSVDPRSRNSGRWTMVDPDHH